jgi:protein-S-isoprenylcysteine O-methyltransferase Ste14
MALHAWSAIVTIGVSWLSALYIVAAGIEERQLLRSDFGDEYRIYRKKTGAMIPKVWQP